MQLELVLDWDEFPEDVDLNEIYNYFYELLTDNMSMASIHPELLPPVIADLERRF